MHDDVMEAEIEYLECQLTISKTNLHIQNKELERLREALKFYADRQNYEDRPYDQYSKVRDDEGEIARSALQQKDFK